MPLNKSDIRRNILYAFGAQVVSLVLSIIMTLIVPKILGVKAFSYWQLFIFYTSYGGFLHLGLYDGIYLRFGGVSYKELNYVMLGWQFAISMIWQIIICFIISLFTYIYITGDRVFIVVSSCLCILISNSIFFFGYILQAVNNIKYYSISIMIEKMLLIILIIISLFLKKQNYELLIVLYITCRCIALLYNSFHCKEITKAIKINRYPPIEELKKNIGCGLILAFSNVSSMLILGIGRFFIDVNFGIIEFGKVSFSIIMINFFIVFMSQISIVIFPVLRRVDSNNLKLYFVKFNRILTAFLPIIFLLYTPIYFFVNHWIPDYKDSLFYFIFLFPLCCYEGKMQMLNNTFMKVLREEKKLLLFNIISCIISIVLTLVSIYIFHSITIVVLSMLIALCIRSSITELFLSYKYAVIIRNDVLLLWGLTVIFIILHVYLSIFLAAFTFLCLYCIYLLKYKDCVVALKVNMRWIK